MELLGEPGPIWLTVMADKRRARRLYQRAGGAAMPVSAGHGALVDEIFMARLLPGTSLPVAATARPRPAS